MLLSLGGLLINAFILLLILGISQAFGEASLPKSLCATVANAKWFLGKCLCSDVVKVVDSTSVTCPPPTVKNCKQVVDAIGKINGGNTTPGQTCSPTPNDPINLEMTTKRCSQPSAFVCHPRIRSKAMTIGELVHKIESSSSLERVLKRPEFAAFLKKHGVKRKNGICLDIKSPTAVEKCLTLSEELEDKEVLTKARKEKTLKIFQNAKLFLRNYLALTRSALKSRKADRYLKKVNRIDLISKCLDKVALVIGSIRTLGGRKVLGAQGDVCAGAKVLISYPILLADQDNEVLTSIFMHELVHTFSAAIIKKGDLKDDPFEGAISCIKNQMHYGDLKPFYRFYAEALADTIAGAAYWNQFSVKNAPDSDSRIENISTILCGEKDGGRGHESGPTRIDRFLLSHPNARERLGCPSTQYCGAEANL